MIKSKSKITKKTISLTEAEDLINGQHKAHKHFNDEKTKKSKKTPKTSTKPKKIRKK